MIHHSSSTSENNSRKPTGGSPGLLARTTAVYAHCAGNVLTRVHALLAAVLAPFPASSLAGVLRRAGDSVFAANDREACWWGWEITRCRAGLGREYRDLRFTELAQCPECGGDGAAGTGGTCAACSGTGRIVTGFPASLNGVRA